VLTAQMQDFIVSFRAEMSGHEDGVASRGASPSPPLESPGRSERADTLTSPDARRGLGAELATKLASELLDLRQAVVGGLTSLIDTGLERIEIGVTP
jgi:hypothetical protein